MATYTQFKGLENNPDLLGKVEAALWITLRTISIENPATTNHSTRLTWAKDALKDTAGMARQVLKLALVATPTATVDQVLGASDASIQTIVDATVNLMAGITS